MTADNWVVQVNVKVPHDQDNYHDTLINLRGESAEQMELVLAWAQNHAADIAGAAQAIRAAGMVGSAFAGPGTVTVQPQPEQPAQGQWGQQQGPPPQWAGQQPQGYAPPAQQQAPQQQQGPGPMCAHGPMVWREGTGKLSGKPYKGWFCPSRDRSSQCDTQWVR